MARTARVLFTLSMPGRGSWDGRWSGEARNYAIVRVLDTSTVSRLFATPYGHTAFKSWTHRWPDGWVAQVDARILRAGERLPKSDGFNGYDWMVDHIVAYGSTVAPAQEGSRG